MDFFNIVKGKRILHEPIVSMRSYQDGKYDLAADGNVNRIISNWLNAKDCYVDLILPSKDHVTDRGIRLIEDFVKLSNGKVNIIEAEKFYVNAGEQRFDKENILYDMIKPIMKNYDLVIYESNMLGLKLEKEKGDVKTAYWCPASKTVNMLPSFYAEDLVEIDKQIAKTVDYVMPATESQADWWRSFTDKVVLNNLFIDPSLEVFSFAKDDDLVSKIKDFMREGWKIVYIPFRLTDKAYQIDKIIDFLEKSSYKVIVLYSDPNNSKILENKQDSSNLRYIKVSSNRDVYYTILSEIDCIVPYFESVKDVLHVSWNEMIHFNVRIAISLNELDEMLSAKWKIYIFEGFERIGKDTLLDEGFENVVPYKQHAADLNPPDYRDQKGYAHWLISYLKNQANELCNIESDTMMTRLFMSDFVFCNLFGRERIAEKIRSQIESHFEIVNIVLLWKDYDEYLKRLEMIGDDKPEYSKEEFLKIQDLYRKGKYELSRQNKYFYIENITNETSKKEIYDKVKKMMKSLV